MRTDVVSAPTPKTETSCLRPPAPPGTVVKACNACTAGQGLAPDARGLYRRRTAGIAQPTGSAATSWAGAESSCITRSHNDGEQSGAAGVVFGTLLLKPEPPCFDFTFCGLLCGVYPPCSLCSCCNCKHHRCKQHRWCADCLPASQPGTGIWAPKQPVANNDMLLIHASSCCLHLHLLDFPHPILVHHLHHIVRWRNDQPLLHLCDASL